jgi:hypothetical protein
MAGETRGGEAWFGAPPPSVAHPKLWLFMQWLQDTNSSKLIVVLTLISILAFPYILKVAKARKIPALVWLLLMATVGILFMVFNAPLLRFGMGYLFIGPSLAIAIFLHFHARDWAAWISPHYLGLRGRLSYISSQSTFLLFSGSCLIVILIGTSSQYNSRFLLPSPLPEVKLAQKQINDVIYFEPQNRAGMCWAAELPCTPYPSQDISLRKPALGIQGGFLRMP